MIQRDVSDLKPKSAYDFWNHLVQPVSAKIPVPETEEQKVRTESTRNVLPIYVCDTGSELCNLVDVLCFD